MRFILFIMTHIAILASGRGSNARKIIEYFEDKPDFSVALIVSNKKDAAVLQLADEYDIPTHVLKRKSFYQTENILATFQSFHINFIVLAGFLWLLPSYFIQAFPQGIINIHPSLLPKYGGKGMYGMNVHRAVKKAQEKYSGITIHYVNEEYDEGNILFQTTCSIQDSDHPNDIAQKVQQLEHQYFPTIIEAILSN